MVFVLLCGRRELRAISLDAFTFSLTWGSLRVVPTYYLFFVLYLVLSTAPYYSSTVQMFFLYCLL